MYHRLWGIISLLLFAQCTFLPKSAGQFTEQEFNKMADAMASKQVSTMTVEKLNAQKDEVLLLDTREREEYEVSHIPGAVWVGYDDFNLNRLPENIDKSKKIVTYCSVGYRSGIVGEKLQKAGFRNIYNLHGSLFKWVNEGYPTVDTDDKLTHKVHGYNEKWSRWLKKGDVVF